MFPLARVHCNWEEFQSQASEDETMPETRKMLMESANAFSRVRLTELPSKISCHAISSRALGSYKLRLLLQGPASFTVQLGPGGRMQAPEQLRPTVASQSAFVTSARLASGSLRRAKRRPWTALQARRCVAVCITPASWPELDVEP